MLTLKKSLLLLFFLGTINLSLCQEERNADEEERRDERDAEVEKRVIPFVASVAAEMMQHVYCAASKRC
uniref:Host defense peptide brevinin-1-Omar5 n=1 Tax=Odorrana margaretae TaxID=121156 RepID=A0A067XJH6_ODOMA|nr:host defense peptide brevinin-1-Omar5 [Odorrana margaretae]